MKPQTYKAYLQSDEWKAKRTAVRRRARGWCERCKVRVRVDVHHLTYANVGNEPLTDLIGVCRGCHRFLHGRQKRDPAAVQFSKSEIRMARYIQGEDLSSLRKWVGWTPAYEAVSRKLES